MVTCGGCGREMRAGNLARHQRGACRVWDPGGGGGKPQTGVDGPMDGAKGGRDRLDGGGAVEE